RYVHLFGNVGRIGFGLTLAKQRSVLAQHATREAVWTSILGEVSARPRNRISFQPPDEDADRRNVETTDRVSRVDPSNVDRVSKPFEWTTDQIEIFHATNVDRAHTIQVHVVDILIPGEQLKEFNCTGRES